jgi:hypothetical protein
MFPPLTKPTILRAKVSNPPRQLPKNITRYFNAQSEKGSRGGSNDTARVRFRQIGFCSFFVAE